MGSVWNYRDGVVREKSTIIGFDVEATDGPIGEITDESVDVDAGHIVVDTGFWILGKKRILPAGVITRIDRGAEVVHVALTKDQVKDAPDYVPDSDLGDRDEHWTLLERYFLPWV